MSMRNGEAFSKIEEYGKKVEALEIGKKRLERERE